MRKKPATLSDKLNKLFAPEEHSEESGDETTPKFSEFDETPDDVGKNAALSEFRKRNIRFLEDFDRKYKGAVSSRSETLNDEDVEEESDENSDEVEDDFDGDEDSDDEEKEELDDDDDGEHPKMYRTRKQKSLVLLKPHYSEDESEENEDSDQANEEGSEDSTDDDRESLAENAKSSKQSSSQQITLIREENHQDVINKGLAVQNQLKIWERLLEMRIKVQPCLIASNSLPPPSSICRNLASGNEEFLQKSEQVTKIVSETMEQMLELQELLLGRYSETKDLLKSGSKRKASSLKTSNAKQVALDGYEQILASRCKDMEEYRNSVLMKWHDRTNIASKMRNNPKQSLSVLRKIEDSLINREELVRKTQLYRGGYQLLGRQSPSVKTITPAANKREDERVETEEPTTSSIYDGEIFDDSDFYHQMLRELIEFKTSTTESPQEIAKKLAELQKLRNKMKKTVDTKASKGRKIRYVVHNKLVNFMAPVPDYDWTDEAKDELYGSLFGQTPAAEER
ncbi:protein Aatf [Anopheles marshallii]|uniref:protein Aatf n=1 Tax=Anopheles marshallii TaxID=1521116 RepID=UPI00237B8E71|nr:protein Aatf [Anopheles marshallii]